MEDSVQEYIEFAVEQINYIKNIVSDFRNKPDINTFDIKITAQKRLHISMILKTELHRFIDQLRETTNALKDKQRDFKIWWSLIYTSVRREVNPSSLPGNKRLTKSEIESEVITRYENEYKLKLVEMEELEKKAEDIKAKKDFMKDQIEDWNRITYDLQVIARMLEIEAYNNIDPTERIEKKGEVRRQSRS